MKKIRKKSSQAKGRRPIIEITESRDYKAIYASGVFGGVDPNDSRLIFFLDRIKPKIKKGKDITMEVDKVNRELQVEIRMSPSQFISVAKWMNEHAERFGKKIRKKGKDADASYIG